MNIKRVVVVLCVAVLPAICCFAQARGRRQPKTWSSAVVVGTRSHCDHASFPELPFADGDTSYLIAYEFHENMSFWQLGLGYATDVTAGSVSGRVDRVLTPQLNLIMTDRKLWAGLGIMKTYIKGEHKRTTDLYWQAQLGLAIPLGDTLRMQIAGYYVFENFGDIGDFDMDEIEWGFTLSYHF